MPTIFASLISKDDMPNGANLVNAIVASLVLCLQLVPIPAISEGIFWMLFGTSVVQLVPIPAISEGIFWMLFGTSVVFLLLTYIPMFPAFLRLRKVDPNRERVFSFPFKGALMKVAIAVPCIELILAIVATIVPLSAGEFESKIPMLVIFFVLLGVGEIFRIVSAKGRKQEYKGLTPELAASAKGRKQEYKGLTPELAAERLAAEAEEN